MGNAMSDGDEVEAIASSHFRDELISGTCMPKCCDTHAPTHVTGPSCKLSNIPSRRPMMVLPILVGTSGNVAPRTHIKSHEVRLVWSTFAAAVWAWSSLHFTARSIGFRLRSSADARLCSWSARSLRTIPRENFSRVAESLGAAHEMSVPRHNGPEISVAAVWAGPSINDVGDAWEEDATIKDLVARLAARRTPLDDSQKAISDIVTGSESERQKKAKLLFAGLFKTLNHERGEVMGGIERYARKQKEFSDQIRSTILQLRELQDRPDPDQGRIEELTNRVEWDTRIFEERRKTVNFVCEVPVLIEQRLFALARAIQQSLE